LAATGIAKHREAQVSIGWHSQHGQQGNTCCTAMRLFRKGTSPEREVKKKKSGATTTLPPLYTENHRFSKTISARFSSHVSFSDFIILVVVIVVCQLFFDDRRGCRTTRSGRATGAGTSGVSGVELQTEWALIKGAVLVPMPEAAALETSQVVRRIMHLHCPIQHGQTKLTIGRSTWPAGIGPSYGTSPCHTSGLV